MRLPAPAQRLRLPGGLGLARRVRLLCASSAAAPPSEALDVGHVEASLTRAVAGAERRVRDFQETLAGADAEAETRLHAELVQANAHEAQRGESVLRCTDWATGEEVEIAIDPIEGARYTGQQLHKQASKLKRTIRHVTPLLAAARAQHAGLGDLQAQLRAELKRHGTEGESTQALLRRVTAALSKAGLLKQEKQTKAQRAAAAAAKAEAKAAAAAAAARADSSDGGSDDDTAEGPPAGGALPAGVRRFVAPSGAEVLLGRSSAANESVTHQLARPRDLWLHARGSPGSHVILRAPDGEPDCDDVEFAANLAAFYSKQKQGGKVPVVATEAKHVRKAGRALGAVQIKQGRERTVVGRPARSEAALNEKNNK